MHTQQSSFAFNEKPSEEQSPGKVLSSARLTLAGLDLLSERSPSISLSAEIFPQKQLRSLTRGLDLEIQCIPLSPGLISRMKTAMMQQNKSEVVLSFLQAFRGLKLSQAQLLGALDDPHSPWRELPCFYEHMLKARTLYIALDGERFIGSMGEKRSLIESICGTRILHRDEFVAWCAEMKTAKRKLSDNPAHWSIKSRRRRGH